MTRRKSKAKMAAASGDLKKAIDTTLEGDKENVSYESKIVGIGSLKSLLEDDPGPSTSSVADNLGHNTAALHDELDSFRQKWKRELEVDKKPGSETDKDFSLQVGTSRDVLKQPEHESRVLKSSNAILKESFQATNNLNDDPKQVYAMAKELFLIGASLEQDELHHESIRYYKQAVHLCPDIEKQIYLEQCEASTKNKVADIPDKRVNANNKDDDTKKKESPCDDEELPLLDRLRNNHYDDLEGKQLTYCKPAQKLKSNTTHISILPLELMLQIFRYVIGQELDLASLETMGMVCRGFFILSRDSSLWRSVCYSTWGKETFSESSPQVRENKANVENSYDWRQVYTEKPRLNYDGVYISRTRYIRQGDTGFQDLTYRPFHVVRYFRYLRFFPDKRVLILTTNEEPERIVPIFRHAFDAKRFSSELSILEGTYEFSNSNQVVIVAERDCRLAPHSQNLTRRQAQFQWSRQTPLSQKFHLKFEVKTTLSSRPFRNGILKWLDYTIITTLETGQEVTSFDLSPDSFPTLQFCRVKRFNLSVTKPLAGN